MMDSDLQYDAVVDSPVGRIGLTIRGDSLERLSFLPGGPLSPPRNPAARRVASSIRSYFDDPTAVLDIPCRPVGTVFQRKVWRALRAIPPGSVVSYGELAASLGTGARAVGGACRNNPVPLVVPCHRVITAAGGPGGFAGDRGGRLVAIKRALLAMEGVEI
jgi:methylated-DNA-[protein]-cysteine S-methyltransferase